LNLRVDWVRKRVDFFVILFEHGTVIFASLRNPFACSLLGMVDDRSIVLLKRAGILELRGRDRDKLEQRLLSYQRTCDMDPCH
jgi:hypothetical protein